MSRDTTSGRSPARVGAYVLSLAAMALAIDFFLIEPGTLLRVRSVSQGASFAALMAAWLAGCFVVERVVRRSSRDQQARQDAERAADQATRLAQLTAALAQARTPRAAIEAAVQEPLHALKADAGMLLLTSRDGASAEVARAVAHREDVAGSQVVLSEKGPVSDAVGRGAPVIIESAKARALEYPATVVPGTTTFAATVAVPLLIGSRVVAIVQLDFDRPRTLTRDDQEYLSALATYAAQALDRTWQLEFAERARSEAEALRAHADRELIERKNIEHALRSSETRYRALATRTSRLHALSAALSEAVTVDAVARAVVHHGRNLVGAAAGEVTLLVEGGAEFETLHAESADGAAGGGQPRRLPVEEGRVETQVVQSGQPVFIRSLSEWQERYWRSAPVAADGGYESSAAMPLVVEGASIGVVAFHFTVPVNFDEDYQALLLSVAQHCTQALDRARLYESTQRARADAEKANRIKDEFVSIVSHELRTPLNAILGWTTMLQRGTLGSEKSGRALQSIRDNASRQSRLIEELLDFSRVSAGRTTYEMQTLDMRELMRGVVESMSPTAAGRGVELHPSPVPPVQVCGDIRRLEQVFFNLIDNALKFTPPGGSVYLDVRIVEGRVEVQVRDTGAGIEPEFLPVMFDRFRQGDGSTSRTYGGLGLGLSIAKQLIEAHKGTIAAASPGKGRGATFTVQLPIAAHRAEEEHADLTRPAVVHREESEDAEGPRLDGLRVLVVDDEADAREIMAHALETSGATVMVAGNVSEALRILNQAELDVLLADIAMPEEDGFSLIRKVRASTSFRIASLPAAAVTAFTRDEHRQHALAAGFHLHLAKPFEPIELVRAVDMLVRRAIH